MRRLLATLTLTAVAVAGVTLTSTAESASASTGQKYYVNCNAKGAGSGSEATPWTSLSSISKHGDFHAGDQILLKRGSSCRGRLSTTGSGAAGAPIVLGAYGKGSRPLVAGHGTGDSTGAVELRNQQYWTIQDLRITNTAGGRSSRLYRAGVLIRNDSAGKLSGITVQRVDVRSVASSMDKNYGDPREWGGIIAVTSTQRGANWFSGLAIRNNTIVGVGRTGVMVSNHNYPRSADTGVRVSYNRVDKSRGDGIVVRGTTSARVDHNRVSNANSAWPCAECGKISPKTANAGIWTATSKNTRIDHNEAWGTKAKGGDGEGFDVDISAVGTIVEYNYAHDNEAGGVLLCGSRNTIVRFNILQNNGRSAIAFIGSLPAKNTSIYNNTIYNSPKAGARVVRYFNGAHGSGITFKNNLVFNYSWNNYFWPTKKVVTAANTLIGVQGAGRPRDAKTSWVNPGLKKAGSGKTGMSTLKGYKPKHPSTFKRGVAISKTVKVDFFGKKINPKRPPRGAAG